ncbi:MAG TPA: phage baseplate assembly protein V [Sphingomonas sp.]|nr:phage baseplate assembly protein V [Sphingomonas sp.]
MDIGEHRLQLGDIEPSALRFVDAEVTAVDLPAKGQTLQIEEAARPLQIGQRLGWRRLQPFEFASAKTLIDFADRAMIGYDPVTHMLTAALPAGATVVIVADGGFNLTGDVNVDGVIRCTRRVIAEEDVVGGGKSLKSHRHTNVQAGGAISGPPQ